MRGNWHCVISLVSPAENARLSPFAIFPPVDPRQRRARPCEARSLFVPLRAALTRSELLLHGPRPPRSAQLAPVRLLGLVAGSSASVPGPATRRRRRASQLSSSLPPPPPRLAATMSTAAASGPALPAQGAPTAPSKLCVRLLHPAPLFPTSLHSCELTLSLHTTQRDHGGHALDRPAGHLPSLHRRSCVPFSPPALPRSPS